MKAAVVVVGDPGYGKTHLCRKLFPSFKGKSGDSASHVTQKVRNEEHTVGSTKYTVVDTAGYTPKMKNLPDLGSYDYVVIFVVGSARYLSTFENHQKAPCLQHYQDAMVCVRGHNIAQSSDDGGRSIAIDSVTMQTVKEKVKPVRPRHRAGGSAAAAASSGGQGGAAAARVRQHFHVLIQLSLIRPAAQAELEMNSLNVQVAVQHLRADPGPPERRLIGDALLSVVVHKMGLNVVYEQNVKLSEFAQQHPFVKGVIKQMYPDQHEELSEEKTADVVEMLFSLAQEGGRAWRAARKCGIATLSAYFHFAKQ